jgi:hypothetical protein
MISQDEALTLGLRKYRDVFPGGVMPAELEDAAVLSQLVSREVSTIVVSFSLRARREPFILFKADICRRSGEVTVKTITDWHDLADEDLDKSQIVRSGS